MPPRLGVDFRDASEGPHACGVDQSVYAAQAGSRFGYGGPARRFVFDITPDGQAAGSRLAGGFLEPVKAAGQKSYAGAFAAEPDTYAAAQATRGADNDRSHGAGVRSSHVHSLESVVRPARFA
jgi:hypothetical protein